jgi:alkylation response protein AidB-like acyl-CoA dehydrogenase
MDLSLSDDQELLVESFGALLDKRSRPQDVRAAEPLGFDPDLWSALRELGVTQMAVGEEHGGWGASVLDLCLVADCLGRHCAPVPVIETQVTARLLARLGSDALPEVLDGGAVATLALHAPRSGTARGVPAGAVADLVVVRDGTSLGVIRAGASPATTRAQVPNHANLPLADVPLAGARPLVSTDTAGAAPEAAADAAFETALDEWLLLTASALVGMSARALDLAVDYARERHAFGSPIGAFQGIAHRLADAATGMDGARLLVQEAAWSAEAGLAEAAERACMAFAFATDVARQATYWAVHTLGGYGVMLEYDAQLYFRRARGWAAVFGDAEAAYRRVARHRYPRREASYPRPEASHPRPEVSS